VPPGQVTRKQASQIAEAIKNEPTITPCQSFGSLAEGKIVCVIEAAKKELIAAVFKKLSLPYDSIDQIDFEGDHGVVKAA
jgi:nitrate reductase NapAB chaperone NapD